MYRINQSSLDVFDNFIKENNELNLQSLVQKYQWKKLTSDYWGMGLCFYNEQHDTIIQYDTGAITEHHRGTEVFCHLAALNTAIIPVTTEFS